MMMLMTSRWDIIHVTIMRHGQPVGQECSVAEVHEIQKYVSYTIMHATCDSLAEGVISLFYI
jgi:hypothetical protein